MKMMQSDMLRNKELFSIERKKNEINHRPRRVKDYCSLCEKKLSNHAKAYNVDHNFPDNKRVCIDCAYKTTKRKIDLLIIDKNLWDNRFKNHSS